MTTVLLGSVTVCKTLNRKGQGVAQRSPAPAPVIQQRHGHIYRVTAAQVLGRAFTTAVCKAVRGSHVNGKHLVPSEKLHINKTCKAQFCSFEVATKHVILACEALDEEMSSIRPLAVIALN